MIKKTLVCVAGVICIMAVWALAADNTGKETSRAVGMKPAAVKTAKMNARGKVVDISDTAIMIERSIKGNVEKMEFALETPVAGVAVNDAVKIDYSVKEGKLTASRVVKLEATKGVAKNGSKVKLEKTEPATR